MNQFKNLPKLKVLILPLFLFVGVSLGLKSSEGQSITPWWESTKITQAALSDSLADKAGKVSLPNYPANDVLKWSQQRFTPQPKGKELYNVIYEQLLVADDILAKAKQLSNADAVSQQQRLVLWLADAAATQAEVKLNDVVLASRIREVYQLPYLEIAPKDGQSGIGQPHIVEAIAATYERTKQTEKRIAALKTLIRIADTRNLADSTRVELAKIYAQKGDYDRAIAYLEAIRDPSIINATKLIPIYQEKQRAANAQPSASGAALK